MFTRLVLRALALGASLTVLVGADGPAKPLKIYIETDLEGVSGVFKFSQTREKDTPLDIEACEFLMGDIAAVVRGLRAGGATEIIVSDGHGTQAFLPRLMEPGATYIRGRDSGRARPLQVLNGSTDEGRRDDGRRDHSQQRRPASRAYRLGSSHHRRTSGGKLMVESESSRTSEQSASFRGGPQGVERVHGAVD